jgi:hypothetical protein
MTNVLAAPQNLETQPAPVMPEVANRETTLRKLLGVDYDYAMNSGLVDMFYYNPETGEDGLVHTLAGDYKPGTTIPRGFHHGPAAEAVWPTVRLEDGTEQVVTRVEPSSRPRPLMEPSFDFVTIGGLQKVIPQQDKHGKWKEVRVRQGMFPSDYDPLAVLQAIRIAKDTRDISQDVVRKMKGAETHTRSEIIITEGQAPLIDGKSFMKIRLILDAVTGKVITAQPKTRGETIMGLDEEQMWRHAWGI